MSDTAPPRPDRHPPVDAAAWHALHEGVALAPLPAVGALRVTGADRLDFLHGQLAHDVRGLPEGGARRALLLDEKGHARAEATVHRRADDVHLAVEDGGLPWVEARLRAHVVFDQVELQALPDRLATLTLQGPALAELLASLDADVPASGSYAAARWGGAEVLLSSRARSGPGGVDVHLLREAREEVTARLLAAGAVAASARDLEPSRVAAGLPRAATEGGSGVLPQEAGLYDAFSTRKGCYLGQEIMARIEARGRLRRGLAGLRLEGAGLEALLDATAERALLRDGRKAGVLGTVTVHPELGPIALAVLRHDVTEDAALVPAAAPDVTARRVALPFTAPA